MLLQLVRLAGQTVHRDRLITAVWQNEFTSDELLTRAITDLRKAFGDSFRKPEYIETIPKVGYRLIAEVEAEKGPAETNMPDDTPAAEPPDDEQETLAPAPAVAGTSRSMRDHQATVLPLMMMIALALIILVSQRFLTSGDLQASVRPATPLSYTYTSVTADEEFAHNPVLSPNGDFMVYAAQEQPSGRYQLRIRHRDGSYGVRISPEDGASYLAAAIAPDGERLAVTRVQDSDCGIFLMPVYGSVLLSRVADCSREYPHMAFSPDGRQLAYTTPASEQRGPRIALLNLDTSRSQIPHEDGGLEVSAYLPRYTASGDRMAWVRSGVGHQQQLVIWDLVNQELRETIAMQDCCDALDWAPDGERLVVINGRIGHQRIQFVDIANGQLIPVAGSLHSVSLDFSQNLPLLAITRRVDDRSIWRFPLVGSAISTRPYIDSSHSDHSPSVSPDGTRMSFISDRSGDDQLWLHELASGSERQLTRFSNVQLTDPTWSPDGSMLLITAHRSTESDLMVVNLSSGDVQPVALPDVQASLQGHWRLDGQSIAFFCQLGGQWKLCESNLSSPGSIRVIRDDFPFPALVTSLANAARQTEYLYFVSPEDGSLMALDYSSGELHQLMIPPPGARIVTLKPFDFDLILGVASNQHPGQVDLRLLDGESLQGPRELSELRSLGMVSQTDQAFVSDGEFIYVTRNSPVGERLELLLPSQLTQNSAD